MDKLENKKKEWLPVTKHKDLYQRKLQINLTI